MSDAPRGAELGDPLGTPMRMLDGEWELLPTPTIEDLIKHARRFGSHRIADTAVELGYQLEAVTRLITACDVIDREHYEAKKPWAVKYWTKNKKDPEARAKKLLNWVDPEKEEAENAEAA